MRHLTPDQVAWFDRLIWHREGLRREGDYLPAGPGCWEYTAREVHVGWGEEPKLWRGWVDEPRRKQEAAE